MIDDLIDNNKKFLKEFTFEYYDTDTLEEFNLTLQNLSNDNKDLLINKFNNDLQNINLDLQHLKNNKFIFFNKKIKTLKKLRKLYNKKIAKLNKLDDLNKL